VVVNQFAVVRIDDEMVEGAVKKGIDVADKETVNGIGEW